MTAKRYVTLIIKDKLKFFLKPNASPSLSCAKSMGALSPHWIEFAKWARHKHKPNMLSEWEDESALFFKTLPGKSLCKQGYRNTGFKSSKERLT